jgi:hypothetical protein
MYCKVNRYRKFLLLQTNTNHTHSKSPPRIGIVVVRFFAIKEVRTHPQQQFINDILKGSAQIRDRSESSIIDL